MPSISLPLAFAAGLLSMLSPCVFSLIPVYLGYLSGTTLGLGANVSGSWRVFSHALAFVAGFTAIFVVVMGLPTTILSSALQQYATWVTRIGGVVLIVFGLHAMHLIEIPIFNVTRRASLGHQRTPGYLRSVLFGMAFASGWSPCVGPLLGLAMTLAFNDPARAMPFMLAYAMGIAVPFLLAAALLGRTMKWMERLSRHEKTLARVSGGLMVAVGLLLVTGLFTHVNDYLLNLTPPWLIDKL